MNIRELMDELVKNKGFTVNKDLEKPNNLSYLVSYEGGLVYDIQDLTSNKLLSAITTLGIDDNSLFGAWLDKSIVYIDKSLNFKDKEKAIKFGYEQNQLAIFDYENKESIYLEG